jgi:nifR3 family TIM-barrel protein
MSSFWTALPSPFFVQAPMEDVTDAAFRRMIARYGRPDVMFTEFTSADGLVLAPAEGQKVLRKKLEFHESERPVVAQLFSTYPDRMREAARIVQDLGFDGLDINMGCPVREVVNSGCGAALIKNPELAQALVRAAHEGAPNIPISVKTRIGYRVNEIETWIPQILDTPLSALTVHLRTREEMSEVHAHWELMNRIVEIAREKRPDVVILGNGDVKNIDEAQKKTEETGCDGMMLGRAIYGNPWLYAQRKTPPTREEKIKALLEHLELFEELMSDTQDFAVMKKHFKAYISGWEGAKEERVRLMGTSTVSDATMFLKSV